MIDAAIPLSVRPVEFNGDRLVNALQQGQQRRDALQLHQQQMQLNQQRIQEGDIALQKARQAERDAGISQQAFAETPDGNLKKWLKRGTELGWSAEGRMGAEQHANAIFTNELSRQKTGDEITASRNDRSREILAQADHIEAQSPEEYQRAYPSMYDALSANDPEFAQHFERNTPPSAAERNAMKFHYAAKGWTEKEIQAQTNAAEEARKVAKDKHDVTMRPLLESEAQSKVSNEQRQSDAALLASAAPGGPDAWLPIMQQIARGPNGIERVKPFGGATTKWTAEDFARAGATPGQLLTTTTREQAERDRVQARKDYLAVRREGFDLRRELADQSEALRRDLAGGRSKGALTGGQLRLEERNISAIEDGTPSRPGLNNLRITYGKLLTPHKDAKGKPVYDKTDSKGKPIYDSNGSLTSDGDAVRAKLDAATDSLQATQYRKAKLYGIQSPDPEDVKMAKDGEQLQGLDGSTWHKQNGVAFFKSMGDSSGAAPSPPPSHAPSQSQPPSATAPNPQANAKPMGGEPEPTLTYVLKGGQYDGKHLSGPKSVVEKFMKDHGYGQQ